MQTGTPTAAAGDALEALRAASARVAQLAPSSHDGGNDTGNDGGNDTGDHAFDAADHAARFEELHEALSAVLDELDRA